MHVGHGSGSMDTRPPHPTGLSHKGWMFAAPYPTLLPPDAGRRGVTATAGRIPAVGSRLPAGPVLADGRLMGRPGP